MLSKNLNIWIFLIVVVFLIMFLLITIRIPLISSIMNDIKVIYEDKYIIVIEKPVNVTVHSAKRWKGANVVDILSSRGYSLGESLLADEQNGVVHRLDTNTSGILILAKDTMAQSILKDQFRNREPEKIYHALVEGHIYPSEGTIDAPVGRLYNILNTHGKKYKYDHTIRYFGVTPNGQESVTHYKTLKVFPNATLVEIKLETGRTHQIRIHMSSIGHPLVGDSLYGGNLEFARQIGVKHQWLTAHQLSFTHPITREYMTFTAAYPPDLKRSLRLMYNSNNKLIYYFPFFM